MTALTHADVDRAWHFLAQSPRRIDHALARHIILEGPPTEVWHHLEAYQCADGGFALGIEPDLRTPESQGISTSVAFQYMRLSRAPSDHPMVRRAVAHLLETLDRRTWTWTALDARVDAAPHAPWWDASDLARYHGFAFNPSAELAGYLFEHCELVPADVLDGLSRSLRRSLSAHQTLPDVYDLYPCIRLFHSHNLPRALKDLLASRLEREITAVDLSDPHSSPFQLLPTPGSPGAGTLASTLPAHAEHLATTQAEDGAWRPFWSWDFVDAEAWEEAEADWSAVLTAQTLIGLSVHGLLPE